MEYLVFSNVDLILGRRKLWLKRQQYQVNKVATEVLQDREPTTAECFSRRCYR